MLLLLRDMKWCVCELTESQWNGHSETAEGDVLMGAGKLAVLHKMDLGDLEAGDWNLQPGLASSGATEARGATSHWTEIEEPAFLCLPRVIVYNPFCSI